MPDESFREFVLDQLSALPELRAKTMFDAYGLYSGAHFFGILDEGRVFFKTNTQSSTDYTSRGMEPFMYMSRGKKVTLNFHEVPPDVLENPREIVEWARKAIHTAVVGKESSKVSKAKKRRILPDP